MRKVFAFIQARSGSFRLPNKVLRSLPEGADKTILDHIHKRLSVVLDTSCIVFLIPTTDIPLQEFLASRHYQFFLGSEENVLDRYIQAAQKYKAEIIIRLTGDNPFLDTDYLELLIETFLSSDSDIMSFQNLPLGTTGEIFRFQSLIKKPLNELEPRHLEHVTLHLKEDSSQYKFTKLNPLYSESDVLIANQIRLTIDELPDYTLASSIYKFLVEEDRFFGIPAILNLYSKSPELFQMNQSVKQLTFAVQHEVSNKQSIFILYAEPSIYGSGHYERCKYIYLKLLAKGYKVTLGSKVPENNTSYSLVIIDHRDIEVPKQFLGSKILLIDNMGPDSKKYPLYYALPHPHISIEESLKNLLLPQLLDLFQSTESSNGILVYGGILQKELCTYLDEYILNLSGGRKITRVGGVPSGRSEVKYIKRLRRTEFYKLLAKSEFYFSYFGQSIFEAIYLETKVFTYSISEYHSSLSHYLMEKIGCIYVGDLYRMDLETISLNHPSKKIAKDIALNGFDRLINIIEGLLIDTL